MLKRSFLTVSTAAALLLATQLTANTARALPVLFHFESSITSSSIPGVTAGDTITIDVVLDNGGTSLLSQTWDVNAGTTAISATASAGSYSADYGTTFTVALFQTNALGVLTTTAFRDEGGTQFDNTDTFGSGAPIGLLFGTALITTPISPSRFAQFSPNNFDASSWTLEFTTIDDVPEPATAVLLAIPLGALGCARRRRRVDPKRLA